MKKLTAIYSIVCLFTLTSCVTSTHNLEKARTPNEPYTNVHLADSPYAMIHAKAALSSLAGPTGPSRRLNADEVTWKPIGPINMYTPIYSAPYPNGKRVMWVGGFDRVAKLDADTLEVLTTHVINESRFLDQQTIENHINNIDSLNDEDFIDANIKAVLPIFSHAVSAYRLLSKDGEFYLGHRGADGTVGIRAYGEKDATDPSSEIELRREWHVPTNVSKGIPYSVNITSGGSLVMVMSDGALILLSQDFKTSSFIQLPRLASNNNDEGKNRDIFATFVRNGVVTDDKDGIYIVTRDYMHRVQIVDNTLSLAQEHGAWKTHYPNETGLGSGTTPALMGWGNDEDHLIIITDSSKSNRLLAMWRDDIPADWQGISGFDRRVAGVSTINFGVSEDEEVQIENTPIVYGYGVFFDNTNPVKPWADQGGAVKQWIAESFAMHVPGHEAKGGAMIKWNPETRTLEQAWQNQTNYASTVCTVSSATETIYCWGARDREWTLEGTDFHTGESTFHYTLGKSHRFNPLGGLIVVAPNGAIDCGCVGGFGMVRVHPKD